MKSAQHPGAELFDLEALSQPSHERGGSSANLLYHGARSSTSDLNNDGDNLYDDAGPSKASQHDLERPDSDAEDRPRDYSKTTDYQDLGTQYEESLPLIY